LTSAASVAVAHQGVAGCHTNTRDPIAENNFSIVYNILQSGWAQIILKDVRVQYAHCSFSITVCSPFAAEHQAEEFIPSGDLLHKAGCPTRICKIKVSNEVGLGVGVGVILIRCQQHKYQSKSRSYSSDVNSTNVNQNLENCCPNLPKCNYKFLV
jgi:hypothetical protein